MRFVPLGIIPTCTGNTQSGRLTSKFKWDHPRTCGEHFIISARGLGKTGSSPHVRGALMPDQTDVRQSGIIPACAGSTTAPSEPKPAPRDHPRMCGEHARQAERTVRRSGSSPHVQGAPLACEFFDCQHGIIPACAGSTASYCSISGLSRDHPRMCGEHLPYASP